jgi:hypothetical protein
VHALHRFTCRRPSLESVAWARQRRLRTTAGVDATAVSGAFAEPSSGLEPETPSLPCRVGGNGSRPTATVFPCFRRLPSCPFATGCHRLQPRGSIKAPSSVVYRGKTPAPRWGSAPKRAARFSATGSGARCSMTAAGLQDRIGKLRGHHRGSLTPRRQPRPAPNGQPAAELKGAISSVVRGGYTMECGTLCAAAVSMGAWSRRGRRGCVPLLRLSRRRSASSFLLGGNLHETFANGPQRRLCARREMELGEDVRDMRTRRSLADPQLGCDFLVALARSE